MSVDGAWRKLYEDQRKQNPLPKVLSDDFRKVDARTIHFEVDVPPDGEKVVTYTVKYTW